MTTFVFPGQGSQFKGMGEDLFGLFKDLTATANTILGYSIEELCLEDPEKKLNRTQYTQPALYVVNAFSYLHNVAQTGRTPDFLAGHSLGEYSALFASGVLDFETGLKLVKKRGQLMSEAGAGAMAAIVGLSEERINTIMSEHGLSEIDIANYNAPAQVVISGLHEHLAHARSVFELAGATCIPLNVSAAFHSRHMRGASKQFAEFLREAQFSEPAVPVISNVHARPYELQHIRETLQNQITHSVRWTHSIEYLIENDQTEFEEIGPGQVLTKLVQKILAAVKAPPPPSWNAISFSKVEGPTTPRADQLRPESLGSPSFRRDYNLRYAYVAGSMYKAIASKELVVTMGKAGLLGYFGAGGLRMQAIEDAIRYIQKELTAGEAYGMNLLYSLDRPEIEEQTADLYLRYGVRNIEAAGYMEITPALVRFRLKGLKPDRDGKARCDNKILSKVSRPEVGEAFLSPPPQRIVMKLLKEGKLTEEEARLSQQVPMTDAICVEADSGGHTDRGVATTLIPRFLQMRERFVQRFGYRNNIALGAAGGIGTPEAAAAAFILGADFILTGSVNQCTVEAGNSEAVKDLLEQMDVRDTAYAPAGDMFELGAKVQVLKKGLLFPARANKLYDLYRRFNSLEDLDEKTRQEIQNKYFKRTFDQVYEETRAYYLRHDPKQVETAERDPKHKMALLFRWYFIHTMRLALTGSPEQRVDYQVHCGSALGAFNHWVKGTDLQSWRNRHVDVIAERLMQATAALLSQRFRSLHGVSHEHEKLTSDHVWRAAEMLTVENKSEHSMSSARVSRV